MKTFVVYASLTQITPMHRPLTTSVRHENVIQSAPGGVLWLRMEVDEHDKATALKRAEPMMGEIILGAM